MAIGGGYDAIRNDYWARIFDAVKDYLTGDRPVTAFQNSFLNAMGESFTDAVYEGYQNGGGDLPMDEDTTAWLGDRIANERGYITDVFQRLKQDWDKIDPIHEAMQRADGYAGTLDAIYNEAKMRGGQNVTLEFGGDDGKESCPECRKMKGKRHKIKYILDNNLIPAPGNDAYSCGGYNCEHYWFNPKTGERYA